MNGTVVSIFMTPSSGTVLSAVNEAVLEAGRGLVGDRYYLGSGTFSESLKGKPEAEITLIEYEEIEQFNRTERTNRSPGAFRRNIVTRGVRLNDLVGRRFRLGAAELEGICLCEPCGHLAKLVSPSVVKRMVHRAGLRARIVSGAVIKPGDTVEVPDPGLTVVRGGRERQALGDPSASPLALAVKVLWSVGAAIVISLGAYAWWSHRTASPREGAHASAPVGLATAPGSDANGQNAPASKTYGSSTQVPTWLRGTWSREWLQEGKERSSTLDVHYLQTPTYFADVRIPKDRTGISNARSFTELTDKQLRQLAGQNGFIGRTTLAGPMATWQHEMAFRPSDDTPDKGRLERVSPDRMYEHGLDGSYIESWKFLSDGQGQFLVIRVEHSGRLVRALVVVGNQFVYVRNRTKDLPLSPSFDALFTATNATREQIIEYLDCEFSVGRVRGGSAPWAIEQSTLPWREGHRLDFVDQVSIDDRGIVPVPMNVGEDQWTVPVNTLSPDEIKALFGSRPRG